MNITSYNINDVTFHYIGLRVLHALSSNTAKATQMETISQSIYNHVCDRSLRLMLPEPKGTYKVAGEKVCQELRHFGFVSAEKGAPYRLTKSGLDTLVLLEENRFAELRRVMVEVHLRTYDNLRAVLLHHLDGTAVWRPVVEERRLQESGYVRHLLEPTFGAAAQLHADAVVEQANGQRPKDVESELTSLVLSRLFGNLKMKTALFRTLCDRLASLRLLNMRRAKQNHCDFIKTYSPCKSSDTQLSWYAPLDIAAEGGASSVIYFCEPNMKARGCQNAVLEALDVAFRELPAIGGYHAIPDLRDFVCERLMIPEPAFDDAVNRLLDRPVPVLSAGLGYEGITAQRKPLVRRRGDTQLHNLLRRVK